MESLVSSSDEFLLRTKQHLSAKKQYLNNTFYSHATISKQETKE